MCVANIHVYVRKPLIRGGCKIEVIYIYISREGSIILNNCHRCQYALKILYSALICMYVRMIPPDCEYKYNIFMM